VLICTVVLPLQIGPDHVSSQEWFQKLHLDDLVTLSFATGIMSGVCAVCVLGGGVECVCVWGGGGGVLRLSWVLTEVQIFGTHPKDWC
jgi:hypothetical protein